MLTLQEEYPQEACLEKYIPESGDVAIDIGCNVGHWTKVLASRFRRVHAIEPQPGCVSAVADLRLPNVVIHRVAAWCSVGSVMFRTHNLGSSFQGTICGADGFVNSLGVVEQYAVESRPVDLLGIGGAIDFVKMDVDGAEVFAMHGLQSTISKHKPRLLIETHHDEGRAWLRVWLMKLGYSVSILEETRIVDRERWNDDTIYMVADSRHDIQ